MRSRMDAVHTPWLALQRCTIFCQPAIAGGLPPKHALGRASPCVQRCGGGVSSAHACSPALYCSSRYFATGSCTRSEAGENDADAAISADAEPTGARQGCEQPRNDFQQPLGGHIVDRFAHREADCVQNGRRRGLGATGCGAIMLWRSISE